ncbi:MAG: diadenylate cyclase CdaA [Bacteriovoracaceae bacterium]|nr:diadenylate cyclase CdaA [Bacteriovoracaceae bacterium]
MDILFQLSFKDALDIAVVALLIYQILFMVKGTRAVQMLLGVAAFGVIFWVSFSYQLHTLHWILGHFFNSFFVIFIILFQDQIRSALANFGSGRRVWGAGTRGASGPSIDEIVEASIAMGRKRIGGIVVLERVNGLKNFVSTGTQLLSEIHCDLIYAIFQSTSPLHDGAIITKKGKMLAAGCFLPLSKNVDVDRHLGTRHRAALGITESTDAVAVVVSEETGKVSIAERGNFYAVEGKVELARTLKRLMSGKAISLPKREE